MNVLFVTEKYCEPNGPRDSSNYTNSFHNLFETCEEMGFDQHHMWVDDLWWDSIDEQILDLLSDEEVREVKGPERTTHIVYSYYGCDYSKNPQLATIAQIKEYRPDIKQVHVWWDASHPCIQQQVRDLAQFTDLQINIDGTELSHLAENTFFAGCPQSPRLFHKDNQSIDISFVGRTEHYADRCHYLGTLIDKGFNVNVAGGRTQQNLTPDDYAKIVRQSKININFNRTPHGWTQIKGRVWEIIQSESLLFEQHNPLLHRYLEPGVDYVEFNSPEDLINKAEYYLNNEDARQNVIVSAKKKLEQYFNYKVLWNKINEI